MDTTKDTQKRLSNLRSKLKDVAARKDPDLAEPLRQLIMKLEGQLEPHAAEDEDERVALANYLERVIAGLTTTTTKEPPPAPAKATKAAPPTRARRS